MGLFKREPLMSCGEARERMLKAPLIKYYLKKINKEISARAKNGYEDLDFCIHSGDAPVVDDVIEAVQRRGYEVSDIRQNYHYYFTISWKIREKKT